MQDLIESCNTGLYHWADARLSGAGQRQPKAKARVRTRAKVLDSLNRLCEGLHCAAVKVVWDSCQLGVTAFGRGPLFKHDYAVTAGGCAGCRGLLTRDSTRAFMWAYASP